MTAPYYVWAPGSEVFHDAFFSVPDCASYVKNYPRFEWWTVGDEPPEGRRLCKSCENRRGDG